MTGLVPPEPLQTEQGSKTSFDFVRRCRWRVAAAPIIFSSHTNSTQRTNSKGDTMKKWTLFYLMLVTTGIAQAASNPNAKVYSMQDIGSTISISASKITCDKDLMTSGYSENRPGIAVALRIVTGLTCKDIAEAFRASNGNFVMTVVSAGAVFEDEVSQGDMSDFQVTRIEQQVLHVEFRIGNSTYEADVKNRLHFQTRRYGTRFYP
jgi:hypothetical protein